MFDILKGLHVVDMMVYSQMALGMLRAAKSNTRACRRSRQWGPRGTVTGDGSNGNGLSPALRFQEWGRQSQVLSRCKYFTSTGLVKKTFHLPFSRGKEYSEKWLSSVVLMFTCMKTFSDTHQKIAACINLTCIFISEFQACGSAMTDARLFSAAKLIALEHQF